jgi:hypothetical protein
MSEKKEVTGAAPQAVPAKVDGVDVAALAKQVQSACATLRQVKTWLEVAFGMDIDGDGVIGSARVGLLAVVAGACLALAPVFAANEIVWQTDYDQDGTAEFSVDQEGDVVANSVSVGTLGSATAALTCSNATVNGTLTVGTIAEKGTGGVTVEGLLLNDGVYADADGSLTVSNYTQTAGGVCTFATINEVGTGGVTVEGTLFNDGAVSDADGSLAISNITLTAAGELKADNINEVGTSGISIEGFTVNDGDLTDADGAITVSNLTLTAGGIVTADTVEEAGTGGVSIEGLTLNDGAYTDADGSVTVSNVSLTAGGNLVAGANTLTSGDKLDGEQLGDDTVDGDSLDWAAFTDLADGGAVSWGNIAEGELADSTVVSADIKDGEVANADISSTAAIALTKLATTGVLTPVAAACSSAESVADIVKTVVTFTNVQMVATDTSDEGESAKVADFDAGAFTILSAVLDATCTISAGATSDWYIACGTAAAGDDSDLTSTEADVIPKTTIASGAGAKAGDAVLSAVIVMDGTSAAKDLYFNMAIDDDNMDADFTNTVTGTLTIYTTPALDN